MCAEIFQQTRTDRGISIGTGGNNKNKLNITIGDGSVIQSFVFDHDEVPLNVRTMRTITMSSPTQTGGRELRLYIDGRFIAKKDASALKKNLYSSGKLVMGGSMENGNRFFGELNRITLREGTGGVVLSFPKDATTRALVTSPIDVLYGGTIRFGLILLRIIDPLLLLARQQDS